MSHTATKWAFDQPELHPDMKPSELVVLAVLADCHNPVNGCYPSQDYISSRTNLSERAVRDQLSRLRERGLIDWDGAREGGRRGSNRYRLGCEADFQPANPAGRDPTAEPVELPAKSAGRISGELPANSDASTGKTEPFYRQNLPLHKEEPVIEPVREPLREARASEREGGQTCDVADDAKAIDRAFWRIVKGWPGFDGMPKEAAKPAFVALTADERADAERKLPGWLELLRSQHKRHVPAPSTYFREKLWIAVPEPGEAATNSRSVAARPFGPDWGAARMAALLRGPTGPKPMLTRVEQALVEKGTLNREVLLAEKQARDGWPAVNELHKRAESRQTTAVAARFATLAELMEPVPVGSAVFEAWRRHHQQKGWPFVPDPGALPVVWFPAGGPEALAAFAAAAAEDAGMQAAGETTRGDR